MGEVNQRERKLRLATDVHNAVGPPSSADMRLRLEDLYGVVRDRFANLSARLQPTHINELINEFNVKDQQALAWQSRYRLAERTRILLFFVVLLIGAVTLSPLANVLPQGLLASIPILQGVLIVLALVGMVISLTGGFYQRWRGARAVAEHARGRFFREISTPVVGEPELLLQQLEFLRRYRLQHQYAYFLFKVGQHENSERWRRNMAYVAGALAFIVTLPLIGELAAALEFKQVSSLFDAVGRRLMPEFMRPAERYVIAASVVIAGLEASIANYYRVEQDMRFAAHFRDTGQALARIARALPAVRQAVLEGEHDAVQRWARRLEDVLGDEHEEWLIKHQGKSEQLAPLETLDPWPHG